MVWQVLAWRWLANAAVGGLIVLALGGLAVAALPPAGAAGAAGRPDAARAAWSSPLLIGTSRSRRGGRPGCSRLRPGTVSRAVRPIGPPAAPGTDRQSRGRRQRSEVARGSPIDAREPTPATPGSGHRGRRCRRLGGRAAAVSRRRHPVAVSRRRAAGLAAWWLFGQSCCGGSTARRGPAPAAVRDRFLAISGPAGERVRLLVSDRIALPFTYTWARPVILLPARSATGDDEAALRYALAHEWSHVERRDAWAWNLAALAGVRPVLPAAVLVAAAAAPALPGLPGRRPGRGGRLARGLCRLSRPARAGRPVGIAVCPPWASATGGRTSIGGSSCSSQDREPWSVAAGRPGAWPPAASPPS